MPAANIMATQDTVRNSGFSPSLPSGMLPNLPRASHSTKTTKREARTIKSQPVYCITQFRAIWEVVARLSPPGETPGDEGQSEHARDAEGCLVKGEGAAPAQTGRLLSFGLSQFLDDLFGSSESGRLVAAVSGWRATSSGLVAGGQLFRCWFDVTVCCHERVLWSASAWVGLRYGLRLSGREAGWAPRRIR